jgi:hypothetical protein
MTRDSVFSRVGTKLVRAAQDKELSESISANRYYLGPGFDYFYVRLVLDLKDVGQMLRRSDNAASNSLRRVRDRLSGWDIPTAHPIFGSSNNLGIC